MDLDQMSQLMLEHAREFKRNDNPEFLKEGLLICLSRPDEDAVIEKTISTVRTPLEDNSLWESAVTELIDKSLAVIKEDQLSAVDQVTYSIVLENLISEFRPRFIKQYKSPGFETRMIEKIAQADIQLSSVANAERELNLMKTSFSPSGVAEKLIDRREEFLKQEKEKN
jgi:hypothetical protein